MKKFLLALAFLLTLAIPAGLVGQVSTKKTIEIPYYEAPNGVIVLMLDINGQESVAMMDTGATNTSFDFKKFGVKPLRSAKYGTACGHDITSYEGKAAVCVEGGLCFNDDVTNLDGNLIVLGDSYLRHFSQIIIDREHHSIIFTK